MRSSAWHVVLVATLLLASGCSERIEPEDEERTSGSADELLEESWAQLNGTWQGDGGQGLLLFRPFDVKAYSVRYWLNASLQVQDPGSDLLSGGANVFFIPPQVLPLRLDEKGVFFREQPQFHFGAPGFTWEDKKDGATPATGLGGNKHVGLFAAVAASAPWNLTIDFGRYDANGSLVHEMNYTLGGDALISTGTASVPNDRHASAYAFEETIPSPGWTHFEVKRQPPAAAGYHQFTVRFPDGFTCADPQVEVPVLPAGTTSRVDYAASFRGVAGELRAAYGHADTSTSTRPMLVHIGYDPAQLPEFFQNHYVGPRWGATAKATGCESGGR